MSTASEQRAPRGRGNRPASIARAPIPQSKSSVTSPTTPGPPLSPAIPKQTESKPLATVKPTDQAMTTPAPAPAGNVWEQRRQAQQQARTVTPAASLKDGAKPPAEITAKKNETKAAVATASVKDDSHTPVNGFNASVVREFVGRDASSFQTYKSAGNASKATAAGPKSTMANGQAFFPFLSKQVAQLQGSK